MPYGQLKQQYPFGDTFYLLINNKFDLLTEDLFDDHIG